MTRDAKGFVEIDIAKTSFEARVIVSVLQNAGIPAYLDGALLQDEFGISQALRNAVGVKITVPEDRLEEALDVLKEARGTQELTPDVSVVPVREASPPFFTGIRMIVCVLAFSNFVFLVLWWNARSRLIGDDPIFDVVLTDDGYRYNWKGTNKPAYEFFDRNRNGVHERVENYDKSGVKVSVSVDANEDGVYERFDQLGFHGSARGRYIDSDGNGVFDELLHTFSTGGSAQWFDDDGDGMFDRRIVFDADGKQLFVEVDRGVRGFRLK